MAESVHNVFVSYTSRDAEAALRLADCLCGVERDVWCAEIDFLAGHDFDAIFHAIDSADAFIPVMSPDATASPWVAKEIRAAVTRQLGYRPILILPAYVRHCDPPPALRDLKGVELHSPSAWKIGVAELIAALEGRDSRPRLLTLEDVVKDRVVVPDEVARTVRLFSANIAHISENEDVARLPDRDRERLLNDLRAERPIPAITAGERAELIRFSRGTDERVKRFAVALMNLRKRHKSGITLETAHDEISCLLSSEFSLRDPDMRRWKAEELVREATSSGLLIYSREISEREFDVATYLANPSYDYGPLVDLAGPLVVEWLNRRKLTTSD